MVNKTFSKYIKSAVEFVFKSKSQNMRDTQTLHKAWGETGLCTACCPEICTPYGKLRGQAGFTHTILQPSYISIWPIDSPPKVASWRTSFVGPSIVFTCQSCICKSLSPMPIIVQYYYNGALWLLYYKKYSGKRCVNHEDQDRRSVDRSIVIWWIDLIK